MRSACRHCTGLDVAQGNWAGLSQIRYLIEWVSLGSLPLIFTLDITATSAKADELMTALNQARIRGGEEAHEKISFLETVLRELHRGQGLGFTVGDQVLDRIYLKRTAVRIYGIMSTVITAILALRETEDTTAAAGGLLPQCNLSSVGLRSALADAFGNATCTSIDSAMMAELMRDE
jgi:hypothetical protein